MTPLPEGPVISGRGLTKAFGATPALCGVDVDVRAGEVLAVMGPSGSGKSTLLQCLAGILVPDAGEVHYGIRRVDRLPDAERSVLRRTDFGFVFQFGQLVPELSAVENVALPLLLAGRRRGRPGRRDALRRARDHLGAQGLADVVDRVPGELSGGQAQRVAVARALVAEPRVVFADEPTGALDTLGGEQVLDLLTAGARERGAAVVLVTHEARVAAHADREIVVRDGRVSELASEPSAPSELASEPSAPGAPARSR